MNSAYKKVLIRLSSLLLPLFSFLMAFTSYGQDPLKQVKALKENVLLVRLHVSSVSMEAMLERGLVEQAEALRKEQEETNKEVIEAFRESWDFCPVYFFFSDCSKDIYERRFDQCLMNYDMDTVVPREHIKTFFVADFWYVQKGDEEYFSHYGWDPALDGSGYEQTKKYGGGTELGVDALVLSDHYDHQLREPFPFYVRTYEGFALFRRKKSKTVAILNKKISDYYSYGRY